MGNFKITYGQYQSIHSALDYESVMMYARYFFANAPELKTLSASPVEDRPEDVYNKFGNTQMSDTDIAELNFYYQCSSK